MVATADAYPFRTQPAWLRFGIALAAIAAVFAVDRMAGPMIDDGSHFLLLGVAVMSTAWFAGTGPALAATVLGAVLGAGTAETATIPAASMHLALFLLQGLLLTALVSELRRARRVAEQQLRVADAARRRERAASRMKDEFLGTVSHELRTPLNAVLGWVHLLRTGKLDDATAARGLESIDRNVRLQAQLTSDLLDVSKALTGKLQLQSRPCMLTDAARQALASVQSAARAKAVQIRSRLPDTPVVVMGDPARLRQIVWQLLSNAIKFTPRGGSIDLAVEANGDEAQVVVCDTGRGIDPEFLPRVFDRFTQADGSTTRAVGGLGVGLALIRELIELQGGEVEARNRDGGGAVFTVRFPRHAAAEGVDRSVRTPVAATASPPLQGLRVLVLDQDGEERELLRTVLQQRGALVHTVASVGRAAERQRVAGARLLCARRQSPVARRGPGRTHSCPRTDKRGTYGSTAQTDPRAGAERAAEAARAGVAHRGNRQADGP
jgi:signal transduction histidine kinase